MIAIRTASRLHFGLLSLPSAQESWPTLEGHSLLPRRHFGGVGLMIEQPGVSLSVSKAKTWHAQGPLADRALQFAQSYCAAHTVTDAFRVHIESAAPEHAGFGVGTQLGLAVARAIAELTGQPARDAVTLALEIGRGLRSALGVHGFDRGGFLVEGGKLQSDSISPLIARHDFPEDWRILLIVPLESVGTHGQCENDAFSELARQAPDDHTTDTLCRLVLLSLVPALLERDLVTFGDALFEFNCRVGAMFQVAQGGVYAHPRVAEIVNAVRAFGVRGVGQSSWGPTIFAIADRDRLEGLQVHLASKLDMSTVKTQITVACNHGRVVEMTNA